MEKKISKVEIQHHEKFGKVRFIRENDKFLFIGADITDVLKYKNSRDAMIRHCRGVVKRYIPTKSGVQRVNCIYEGDIYRLVTHSELPSAVEFEEWVFDELIPTTREASGLEGFEVFTMLDKDHQKEAMERLRDGLKQPVKVNYIKANTITNKAVSTMYGHKKMVKKADMTPEMLVKRQSILDDTVNLMTANESFDLGISISKEVYKKYTN